MKNKILWAKTIANPCLLACVEIILEDENKDV